MSDNSDPTNDIEKAALEYEAHLQIFNDYGGDEHARREVGQPVKPAGYDAYKAQKQTIRLISNKEEKTSNWENIAPHLSNLPSAAIKGYVFDDDGVPRYLTADDVYNGIENPAWLKKHKL